MPDLLNFVNAPNKSFFGLDKGSSHSFTIPTSVKDQLIGHFKLGEGNLQTEILLKVDENEYLAEIRMGRILNIRRHRISDRKEGCVLKIQWGKFPETKTKMRDFFKSAREIVIKGEKNKTNFAKFILEEENKFLVTNIINQRFV
jgi:hypothetical protein